jgi:hypothetical protein
VKGQQNASREDAGQSSAGGVPPSYDQAVRVIIRCRLRSRFRARALGQQQRLVVWTMIGGNSWLRRGVSGVITRVEFVVALDPSDTDGICMLLHGPIVG